MNDQTSGAKGGACSDCQFGMSSYIAATPAVIAGVATAVEGASSACHSATNACAGAGADAGSNGSAAAIRAVDAPPGGGVPRRDQPARLVEALRAGGEAGQMRNLGDVERVPVRGGSR